MTDTRAIKALTLALSALWGSHAAAMEPRHLEHPHTRGTWALDYIYMHMNMEGLRSGGEDISVTDATASAMSGGLGYMMAPTEMTMDMHMFMPMYNFTREWAVMGMVQYLSKDMDMVDGNGNASTMHTEGLGDTHLSLTYEFLPEQAAVGVDLSIPTGAIDAEVVMMNMPQRAPYAMQLGSGTYDITPIATYMGAYYHLRYGLQVRYTHRLGENDAGYTLGDEARAKAWVHHPVGRVNLWLAGDYVRWGDIEGADANIRTQTTMMNMTMKTTPTAFTRNYGGTRMDLTVAADMALWGPLTLGVELTRPLYQDLNGDAQMKHDLGFRAYLQALQAIF